MLTDAAGDSGGSSVLKNILSLLMKAKNLISGLLDLTSQLKEAFHLAALSEGVLQRAED